MGKHSRSDVAMAVDITADIEQTITGYFDACTSGQAAAVAEHFTDDAVIFDTNHVPIASAATIGQFWSRIAAKWQGAAWHVERLVTDGDTAAIEWVMTGTAPTPDGSDAAFAVRGSEHYDFAQSNETGELLIAEIRQYWTFDPSQPSSELVEYPYGEPGRLGT
ncbi:nuclear transport factor 2 family protein [Candidatus Poriferisodalis sp.]|uniref:nuclear transport factor 2 family protein n=1 Tax=Candidatus Poriferisodalis sp. TaxID=3101277 RepID=UPI003B025F94